MERPDGSRTPIPDTFFCSRWRCTMSKRVCLMRRNAARQPIHPFDVAADPQSTLSYESCLRCEQGDRIGLEFGITPPRPKPVETHRKCNRCGVPRPIDQFSRYTYQTGWEKTCKECRRVDGARYRESKKNSFVHNRKRGVEKTRGTQ